MSLFYGTGVLYIPNVCVRWSPVNLEDIPRILQELDEEEERTGTKSSIPKSEESDSDLSEEEIENAGHDSETDIEGSDGDIEVEMSLEKLTILGEIK